MLSIIEKIIQERKKNPFNYTTSKESFLFLFRRRKESKNKISKK